MRLRLFLAIPTYLLLYTACYYAAYLLRFEFELPKCALVWFRDSLITVLLVKMTSSLCSLEWHRRLRYTNLTDVVHTGLGSAGAAAILLLLPLVESQLVDNVQFAGPNTGQVETEAVQLQSGNRFVIPRSVVLIDMALSVLAIGLLRVSIRLLAEWIGLGGHHVRRKRAIIFDAEKAGIGILRAVQATSTEYRIVALVDHSGLRQRSLIAGIPVVSARDRLDSIARRLRAEEILLPANLPGREVRRILDACREADLSAHVIPAVDEIVNGRDRVTVSDVTISDLLRREPAQLDMDGIRAYLTGRAVLVTGAAGSIGSEVCRQLCSLRPRDLILFDQSESGIFEMQQELAPPASGGTRLHFVVGDMTDESALTRVISRHRPEILFHAAAYKHVPLMEHNPQEAIRNNIFGTRNLVDVADRFGVARFVLISTDKAVRPTNIMGSSKLIAEKYVQSVAADSRTQFIAVRFGNVLNSAGSVVPTFRRQIESGGPVTVTDPEMRRYFMTIPEAVQLVLQAGAVGDSGDVLILDMGEPVRIVDLARDMINLSGLRCPEDIEIVYTGARPGEKIFEELFYDCEADARRVHDKIFSAPRQAVDSRQVDEVLRRLKPPIR